MPRRPGPPSPAQLSAVTFPTVHLAREVTPELARAQTRDGTWRRVRPGAYISDTDGPQHVRRRSAALAAIVALAQQSSVPLTFSHVSAALVWGLPTVRTDGRTHVVQTSRPGTRGDRGVVRHRVSLPDHHQTVHGGLLVTTLERTVVDCIRTLPPSSGLVIADAALHAGANRARCAQMLGEMPGARGIVKAREILALADAGSESPGETRLRFEALRLGFPVPETQIKVSTRLATYWADLGWRDWKLLLEYDGRSKYDAGPAEVLLQERRRQEAVEDEGWTMVRIMQEDLRTSSLLMARLSRHIPQRALSSRTPRPLLTSP